MKSKDTSKGREIRRKAEMPVEFHKTLVRGIARERPKIKERINNSAAIISIHDKTKTSWNRRIAFYSRMQIRKQ